MTIEFDDLIPNQKKGIEFDDLIPGGKPQPTASWSDNLRDITSAALKIGPTAVKGVADLARLVTGDRIGVDTSNAMKRGMQSFDDLIASDAMRAQQANINQALQDKNVSITDLPGIVASNPRAAGDAAISTVGSMFLPTGAAVGATKVLPAATKIIPSLARLTPGAVATGTSVVTGAAQNAAETFADTEGQDMADRYKGAGISGAASLVLGKLLGGGAEGVVARRLAGESVARGVVNMGKSAAKTSAKEFLQEGGEESSNYVGKQVAKGEAIDPNTMGKQGLYGGMIGLGVGGASDVSTNLSNVAQGSTERQMANAINQAAQEFADRAPPQTVQQTVARIFDRMPQRQAPEPAPQSAPEPLALGFDPAVRNPQPTMVADPTGNVRPMSPDEQLAQQELADRMASIGLTPDVQRAIEMRQQAPEPGPVSPSPSDLIQRLMGTGWQPTAISSQGINPTPDTGLVNAMGQDLEQKFQQDLKEEIRARLASHPKTETQLQPAPAQAPAITAQPNDRYGIDHTPFSAGGKPFKTKLSATKAKKLQPTMRVVRVEGGFALADKTPAQLAAEAKASKRIARARSGNAGAPMSVHEFIAAQGGLSRSVQSDLGIEGNVKIGNRWLYAGPGKGMSIEEATLKLKEAGYITDEEHNTAYDIIRRSVDDPQYTPQGWEQVAEAQQEAQFEDYLAAQKDAAQADGADPFDTLAEAGFTEDDSDGTGFWEADQDLQAEVSALAAQLEAMGVDTYDVLDPIIRANSNATQDQYNEIAKQAITEAIAQATQPAGNRDTVQNDGKQGQARGETETQPQEGLTSYTPQDIEDRLAKLEQAEQERQKQDREAEQRAQADAQRDDFTLTGSNRPADVAAARGQQDIFANEDQQSYNAEAPRRKYTDDRQLQLFLDSEPDPSQSGPAVDRARREAVAAVDDLRSTESILAQALSSDYAARQRVSLVGQKVSSAEDLAVLAQVYRDPRFETFRVVFTNDSGAVVSQVGLTSRLPASTAAIMGADLDGYLKDLSSTARSRGASQYYLLHNHPSGIATASRADERLTQAFAYRTFGTDLQFRGHVVIDTNEYSVINGSGESTLFKRDFGQPAPYQSSEWSDVKISGPADVMAMAKRLQVDQDAVTLIHTDAQFKVKALTTIPTDATIQSVAENRKLLVKSSLRAQGSQLFAVSRNSAALVRIGSLIRDGIWVRDDGTVKSLNESGAITGGQPFPSERRTRVSPDTSPEFAYLRKQQEQQENRQMAAEPGPLYDLARRQDGNPLDRLPEAAKANVINRLDALATRLGDGAITDEQFAQGAQAVIEQVAQRKVNRGPDWVQERLIRAKRKGELEADTVDLALWALSKNPAMATDLAIMVSDTKEPAAGDYNPVTETMRIFKSTASETTAVHEILHHTERMMPPEVQAGILREYNKAWGNAYNKGDAKVKGLLRDMLMAAAGDKKAMDRVVQGFEDGTLDYDTHYALFNPSEFWAVKASDIMAKRYAVQGSWVAQAKQWLRELIQLMKGKLGLSSDAPIIKALEAVLEGDGTKFSKDILANTENLGDMQRQEVLRDIQKNNLQSAAETWTVPEPGTMDNAIRAIQNNKIDMKRVRDSIAERFGKVNEDADAYLNEELYHGKVAARVEAIYKDRVEPILAKIAVAGKNAGVTMDDVNQYLHARHAPDRNAAMKAINPGMQNNEALSGMSNQEAAKVMADFTAAGKDKALALIARDVDQLLSDTRTDLVADGLEDAGVIAAWEAAYKHYVPLQRDIGSSGTPKGMGFSVRGPESKRAVGSNKEVVNILANIVAQAETAAIRAEKATVGRSLLAMARQYPNPDFWTVDKAPTKPRINKDTGLVERNAVDPMFQTADNVIMVKDYGQEHFIVFNKKNERAMATAKAMKHLDIAPMNKIFEVANKGTRFLASLLTQRNPLFWLTNFARDVQGAMLNLEGTEAEGLQRQVMANLPKAFKGMHAVVRGQGTGQWARFAKEMQEAGGTTGYMQAFDNSDARMKDLTTEVERMQQGKADPRRLARLALEFVDDYNDIIENAVRLSVFQAAREGGASTAKSASIAKNITVNFNRKGNLTPPINALYMFFNASVQGTARLLQATATSKTAQAAVGGIAVMGFLLDMLNRMAAGDDEETKRNRYDLIPEFEKSRNWIFMNPMRPGEYVKVPLPLGPHVVHNFGRLMSDALNRDDARNAVEYGWSIASLFVDAFSPMGSAPSLTQLVFPSVLDPLAQVAENKSFTGAPVYKSADRFGKTDPKPAYTRFFDSTPDVWKGASRMLNDMSGGDKVKPGMVNIEPDILKHVFYTLTGGPGRTLDQTIDMTQAGARGKELTVNRVPLASRFYGANDDQQRERAYYDDRKRAGDAKTQFDYYVKQGRMDLAKEVAKELGDGDEAKGRKQMLEFSRAEKSVRKINGEIRRQMERDDDGEAKAEQLKALRQRRVRVMSDALDGE